MRIYRVRLADGRERQIAADRVTGDAMSTTFEIRTQGRWEIVLHLPTVGIESIARRITEVDGRWTWVKTDPLKTGSDGTPISAPAGIEAVRG